MIKGLICFILGVFTGICLMCICITAKFAEEIDKDLKE